MNKPVSLPEPLLGAIADVMFGEEQARAAADRELADRIAALEARPVEKDEVVPPELAEQIKSAIHLLHESPPIVQQRSASPLPPRRVRRIERDENGGYTLIDDEPQS